MKPLSLAARIQISIVIPALLFLVSALALSAHFFSEHFYQEERQDMADLEHELSAILRSSGLEGLKTQAIPPSHHVFVYAVFSADGSHAVFSNNHSAKKVLAEPVEAPFVTRNIEGEHFQVWNAEPPLPPGIREIRMAINVQSRVNFEHFQLTWFSALMVMLGALITVLVTVTVRRGFRYLNRISDDIAAVSATNLSVRWLPQQFPREIAPLVRALNRMLDQIEGDYRYLEQFSDAMAHELKTPLTSQIACLELALMRSRSGKTTGRPCNTR
ncbi:HAMP domain-containing protein [Hahella sp. SMD15-11]|uniref:histidine kinase n=1 Tax=Thermohahella caldifontis TaxID=3142973 RepID=A0AB39UTL7_9GAMM